MVGKEKRECRATDAIQKMNGSTCVFLTLTTRDIVSYAEIRQRWRDLRHWLIRRLGKPLYIMNYEVHPKGHGWHIHCVIQSYVNLRKYLKKIQSFGFGRVNVKPITNLGIADYITKHCLKPYRGAGKASFSMGEYKRCRLINQSRGLPVLADYVYESEYIDSLHKYFQQSSAHSFSPRRKLFADLCYYYDLEKYQEALTRFQLHVYESIKIF